MTEEKYHIKDIQWNKEEESFSFSSRSGRYAFNIPKSKEHQKLGSTIENSNQQDIYFYDIIEKIIEIPDIGTFILFKFKNRMSCIVKIKEKITLKDVFTDKEEEEYINTLDQSIYKRDLKVLLEEGQYELSEYEIKIVKKLMKAKDKGLVEYVTEHRGVNTIETSENFLYIVGVNYISVNRIHDINESLGDLPRDLDTEFFAISENDHIAIKEKNALNVSIFNLDKNMNSIDIEEDIIKIEEPIQCMTISPNGKLLVVASQSGKNLYVYKTQPTGNAILLRRGRNSAVVHSLVVSSDNSYVACYSSTGTIHVFSFETEQNQKSILSSVPMLNKLTSVNYIWSMTKYNADVLLVNGPSNERTRVPSNGVLSFEHLGGTSYQIRLMTIKGNLVGFNFTCQKNEDGTPAVTHTTEFEYQLWWNFEKNSPLNPQFYEFKDVLETIANIKNPKDENAYIPMIVANWQPHPMLEKIPRYHQFLSNAYVQEKIELARIRCDDEANLNDLAKSLQLSWDINQVKFLAKKSLVQLVSSQPIFPLYQAFPAKDGVLRLSYEATYEEQ